MRLSQGRCRITLRGQQDEHRRGGSEWGWSTATPKASISPATHDLEGTELADAVDDDGYSQKVGERLRAIRRQKRLSLQEVETSSRQEFKASVVGAYERGERAISVPRLQRLAAFYEVPIDQLLPARPRRPQRAASSTSPTAPSASPGRSPSTSWPSASSTSPAPTCSPATSR